jgi:gamma-glutamyltranspeptidase/glutathione hydrolase
MGMANVQRLSYTKACAEIYTKSGKPYQVRDLLVQKDYAGTLEIVAEEGPDVFYKGEISEKIIADFEEHGALVTEKDLRECQPYEEDPLETTYREYTIYENVFPTCGPIKGLSFNILENFDLKQLGWLTPKYLHIISRAMQLATIEREEYLMADPKFYPEVWEDWKALNTKEHSLELKELILSNRETPPAPRDLPPLYPDETTHLAAADSEGNVCNLKHTLGDSSGVVTPGLGFMYNNHMLSFDPRPNRRNSVGPGKFGPLGGSPTTVAKDGRPIILTGSPAGERGSTAEVQAIINMIEFGMSPQQAVSVPRIHVDRRWATVIVEPTFPYPYPWRNLARMGNLMEISEYTGRLSAIKIDPDTRDLEGGADPRGGSGLGKTKMK